MCRAHRRKNHHCAHWFFPDAVSETTLWTQHGMDEPLSKPIMPIAQRWLNGLAKRSGLRKCGESLWIEWFLHYKAKAWNQRRIKISIDRARAGGTLLQ